MEGPEPIWTPNLGNPLVYGVPWAPMDPKFGVSLVYGCLSGPEFGGFIHLWGALGPYGPQIWGIPSFMGGPEPIWTLNFGYALVYGVPWAPIDPKFRILPCLWGALGHMDPKLGVSLVHGCLPGPEFGITPRLWGVLSPYGP